MNYFSTFQSIFKQMISQEGLQTILTTHSYTDTARKSSVFDLFVFFAEAASGRWNSFRHGSDLLGCVNHSTISKKATDVPLDIFKAIFSLVLSRTSRKIKRSLKLPQEKFKAPAKSCSSYSC